jgi:hypothetical protein
MAAEEAVDMTREGISTTTEAVAAGEVAMRAGGSLQGGVIPAGEEVTEEVGTGAVVGHSTRMVRVATHTVVAVVAVVAAEIYMRVFIQSHRQVIHTPMHILVGVEETRMSVVADEEVAVQCRSTPTRMCTVPVGVVACMSELHHHQRVDILVRVDGLEAIMLVASVGVPVEEAWADRAAVGGVHPPEVQMDGVVVALLLQSRAPWEVEVEVEEHGEAPGVLLQGMGMEEQLSGVVAEGAVGVGGEMAVARGGERARLAVMPPSAMAMPRVALGAEGVVARAEETCSIRCMSLIQSYQVSWAEVGR